MPDAQENHALQLDEEWVELIASARSMGLSLEEIRLFLGDSNRAAAKRSSTDRCPDSAP
ncbi:DNA-binding anti-repressor SinI [Paenibacillus mesophilus]|uniref:anti-repressor SinI family protein n=1 Tax=Paenibacillus mesophilus TaxID=2582849 RepID=UPI00110E9B47|nr:anti-repressor SinI family protein [Paenibacillus mesophilus]TMV49635.1 DNA-binding anti-repressor SinI [Paenibacillus mesophilus]